MSSEESKLTVCGVTFTAKQVKCATLIIDKREIYIGEKESKAQIGFSTEAIGNDSD